MFESARQKSGRWEGIEDAKKKGIDVGEVL